ncbi:hypothetical protein BDZ45DRAFT_698352 [Acephala macrosclerotiorum]|nr:hypothetical protein BDZ45DRAFT_698352 [Acephala macrosclerotiorum]
MTPGSSNRDIISPIEISQSPLSANEEGIRHSYDDQAREDLEIPDMKAGYPPTLLPQIAEANDAVSDTFSGKSSYYTVPSTRADSEGPEVTEGAEWQDFWSSQWLNNKSSQNLWEAFREVLLNGPYHKLPGVRADPDLTSKEDNPNTLLCIIEESVPGEWDFTKLPLATVRSGGDQTWDIWDSIHEHLRKGWPKEMPTVKEYWWTVSPYKRSVLEHPGHFTTDWAFFEGASVSVTELSFTRFGFPSPEFRRCVQSDGSTTENWPKPWQYVVAQTIDSLPKTGISGRSWTICPDGRTMPWSTFAFSVSQVILGHDLDIVEVAECAVVFPKRYAGPWPTTPWTNWCCVGDARLHAQFHVRYLSPLRNAITDSDPKPRHSGLRFERDCWHIAGSGGGTDFSIVETRSSTAILTSLSGQLPYYSMVTHTDTPGFSLDCIGDQVTWTALGLSPCHEFAGVAIFLCAVGRLITEWSKHWDLTLKLISSMSRVKIEDILDPVKRRNLMRGDFEAQEQRFVARQLLFKSHNMIGELAGDLQSLTNDLCASTTLIEPNSSVGANCEKLLSYQRGIEHRLIDRIKSKLTELGSLDALHATSVPWG